MSWCATAGCRAGTCVAGFPCPTPRCRGRGWRRRRIPCARAAAHPCDAARWSSPADQNAARSRDADPATDADRERSAPRRSRTRLLSPQDRMAASGADKSTSPISAAKFGVTGQTVMAMVVASRCGSLCRCRIESQRAGHGNAAVAARTNERALLRSLRRRGHDLIGLVEQRLGLGDVGADARKRLHHLRLLVGRQADQFAAGIGPAFARLVDDVVRDRTDRGLLLGGVVIDEFLQVGRQRIRTRSC